MVRLTGGCQRNLKVDAPVGPAQTFFVVVAMDGEYAAPNTCACSDAMRFMQTRAVISRKWWLID